MKMNFHNDVCPLNLLEIQSGADHMCKHYVVKSAYTFKSLLLSNSDKCL